MIAKSDAIISITKWIFRRAELFRDRVEKLRARDAMQRQHNVMRRAYAGNPSHLSIPGTTNHEMGS